MPSLVAFLALVYGQIITDLTIRFARATRTTHIERWVWAQPGGLSSPAVEKGAGRKTQPWNGCSQQRKLNPEARFNTTHSMMPARFTKMCTQHAPSLGRLRSAYCISERRKKDSSKYKQISGRISLFWPKSCLMCKAQTLGRCDHVSPQL